MRWFSAILLLGVTSCAADDESGADPNYCPKVEEWNDDWGDLENEVVALVNERRSEGGVCDGESFGPSSPLEMDSSLRCAARNHSMDMATRGYFAHESPDGENFDDRIERAGFGEYSAIGENIARGPSTAAEVMALWMASAGHCSNILEPRFELIGVGYYGDGNYWTQTFGTRF